MIDYIGMRKESLRNGINELIKNMYYIGFLGDDAEIFLKRAMQKLHRKIGKLKKLNEVGNE